MSRLGRGESVAIESGAEGGRGSGRVSCPLYGVVRRVLSERGVAGDMATAGGGRSAGTVGIPGAGAGPPSGE